MHHFQIHFSQPQYSCLIMGKQLSIQFPRQKYAVILDSSLIQLPITESIKSQNNIFHFYHYSPISEDHHFLLYIMAIFLRGWSKFGSLQCIYHATLRISFLKWKPNVGASLLKLFMVTYYIKGGKNTTNYWRLLPNILLNDLTPVVFLNPLSCQFCPC